MSKYKQLLIVCIAGIFIFLQPQTGHSQTAIDSLFQYVRQLRSDPENYSLKERIINISHRLNAPLPVPFESDSFNVRGKTAFKYAISPADFNNAISEFKRAILAGPWQPEPYYNIAKAQEINGYNRDAIDNYKLYLLAAPAAQDALTVREKITELQYLIEHPAPTAQQIDKQKEDKLKEEQEKLKKIQEEERKKMDESAKNEERLKKKQERLDRCIPLSIINCLRCF